MKLDEKFSEYKWHLWKRMGYGWILWQTSQQSRHFTKAINANLIVTAEEKSGDQ